MKNPADLPTGPLEGPLQDMRRAVRALRPLLETGDQKADLAVIEDALARLSRPPAATPSLAEFDPSRLSHLLEITGPDLAVELLARLSEDLASTQDLLLSGSATFDWKRLREGSHVLISLSGSVGALSLQAMAENLNASAHRQDRDAVAAQMPPLNGELEALIHLIRATRLPLGSAR